MSASGHPRRQRPKTQQAACVDTPPCPTAELVIVGGGAAGLMAGCAAGEIGLPAVILERKHKPGRKLLMCGNGRCNLTTNISAERMLQMFGPPMDGFLAPALRAFDPSALQRWFAAQGLKTVVKAGNRVYPSTECAGDVLNALTDRLRAHGISLAVSSPVTQLERRGSGFVIRTPNFALEAKRVLLATGGVSYPKTGSVGEGQTWAQRLGHTVTPYRPGLAGFETTPDVHAGRIGRVYEGVRVDVELDGKVAGQTRGAFEIMRWGVAGTAITDASRLVARRPNARVSLRILHADGRTETVTPLRPRPIKEAMVTVGGVALGEIDPQTMASRICPNLYFAGEVMDMDGPTGGYNLQAAFATARLAVRAIGKICAGRSGGHRPA